MDASAPVHLSHGMTTYRRGPHWIALFATVFTLPLLFVGGSVTTYRVGLAVPDWPSTFGINMFLYDFWNAPFGVRVEHTHRLYGAAVGLATIGLCTWLLVFDSRRWMKALGVLALFTVIVQGVLGGTRVTQVSTLLAAIHGCTGQAFFGFMVALCVFTGRNWLEAGPKVDDLAGLRPRSLVLLLMVSAQLALGAWLRHFGVVAALWAHLLLAIGVVAVAINFLWSLRRGDSIRSLAWPSRGLGLALAVQVLLGIAAIIYLLPFGGIPSPVGLYEAMVRTGHQTNAALLLASSIVLALRTTRHLKAHKAALLGRSVISAQTTGPRPASLEIVP